MKMCKCGLRERVPKKAYCRECQIAYGKQYYRDNRERLLKMGRERDPEARWEYNLKRWYGIDGARYYELLAQQGGSCAICGTTVPGGKRVTKFAVDHDHETGRVRGILCHPCNQLIGLAREDPLVLERASAYVALHKVVAA